MNITINLDLEAAIQKAVSMERLAPIIERSLTSALEDAIGAATGYNSEFRKAAQKQLAEAMPHGLEIGEVAKFQQVVNKILTDTAMRSNQKTIATALEKVAKLSMTEAPAKIKMSELIKLYRSSLHTEENVPFYACYEPGEYSFGHLYLSDNARLRSTFSSKYSAKVRIGFDKSDGSVYSLALDGKHITPACTPNIVGRFDDIAFAMYVGRTTIEVDLDADAVEELAAGSGD